MNNYFLSLLLTPVITVSLLLNQPNRALAQTTADDEAAIKAAIIGESAAWARHDFQAWADAWVDSPQTSYANTSGPGTVVYRKGFDELKQVQKKLMSASSTTTIASRDDWHIRVVGNMAWARHMLTTQTDTTKLAGIDLKVLEKIDGKWKISTSSWIGDFKNASPPRRSTY